jgi:hypothetical protein
MAARDLPAMLTHELMTTGVADISYIGHSQGTTVGMAFLSSGSALAQHIKVGSGLRVEGLGPQPAVRCRRFTVEILRQTLTHTVSKEQPVYCHKCSLTDASVCAPQRHCCAGRPLLLVAAQIAVLLAPVAFVTHMDSLPMNALAAMDTDEVGPGVAVGVVCL